MIGGRPVLTEADTRGELPPLQRYARTGKPKSGWATRMTTAPVPSLLS